MIRSKKRFLTPTLLTTLLVAFAATVALAATPSAAISDLGGDGGAPGGPFKTPLYPIEEICDGDCSGLPSTPLTPGGSPFDFELGLSPIRGGFDLSIVSDGNVFLLGPIRAAESIRLTAVTSIDVHGTVEIAADEIHFNTGLTVPPLPPIITPGPGIPPYNPICGCISIGDVGGEVVSIPGLEVSENPRLVMTAGGEIRLVDSGVQAVVAVDSANPGASGVTVTRNGDIYVDLSRVTLNHLKVKAGRSIVIAGIGSLPVPEPGTALLLGLGLAGLASHPPSFRFGLIRAFRLIPADPADARERPKPSAIRIADRDFPALAFASGACPVRPVLGAYPRE